VWETKSAGIRPAYGGIVLSQELVDWTGLVACMEEDREFLQANFTCPPKKVKGANIGDRYSRDDSELVTEMDCKVVPTLEDPEST
jgi:predicted protein tyrosine phosphatase